MSGRVFLDTSVLLAGTIEFHPPHPHAHAVMDAVAERRLAKVATAFHCCLELYSVVTRLPAEYRLAPADAARLVREEIFDRFEVVDLPPLARRELFALAAAEQVGGGRVYDLQIAEVARAAGVSALVTENRRHFTSLLRHGITVLTAEEFAAHLRSRR